MSDIKIVPLVFALGSVEEQISPFTSKESMDWYNNLEVEQKASLKDESFELLTGTTYDNMSKLFSHEELVKIAYDKLKIEGFDV